MTTYSTLELTGLGSGTVVVRKSESEGAHTTAYAVGGFCAPTKGALELTVKINDDFGKADELDGVQLELDGEFEGEAGDYRVDLKLNLSWDQIAVLRAYLDFVANQGRAALFFGEAADRHRG